MPANLLSVREVCKELGVTRATLYNWEAKGLIKLDRLGGTVVRVKREELDRFIAASGGKR
jgi:excisionase family DNA binding protein